MTRDLVFVNGVFDLLHPGHIRLLTAAWRLAPTGKLIVGVNSDESVRRLKGPTRPVLSETARAGVISELWMVDDVRIFEGDTPVKLIEELQPEIVVKGSDWRGKEIPEQGLIDGYGGRVVFVETDEQYSTTKIIAGVKGGKRCI